MALDHSLNTGLGSRFWKLWTATAFSNLGDGICKFVLPVLAAKITDSPGLVAGVSFLLTLPWLLLSLPAGAIVDRADRKKLIIMVNLTRTAGMALLLASVSGGWLSISMIFMVAFILGVCETFSDTTAGTLVPAIVPRNRLDQANARILSAETIMNSFIGGPFAGFLISFSVAMTVMTGSAAYLLTVVMLFVLQGNFKVERAGGKTMREDISEGVRYLWNHRILRTLAIMVAVMSGCWSAFFSILVLYAVDPGPMMLGEFGYSLLLTALAAGSLAGTAMIAPIQKWFGRRWLLGIDIAGTIAMLAVPVFTSNVWLVGAAIFFGGFGGATWSVAVSTIRQSMIPAHLLGRVYSVYRLVGWGTLSLGAILAGIIAEWAGITTVFLGGAIINLFLFIPMVRVLKDENLYPANSETLKA